MRTVLLALVVGCGGTTAPATPPTIAPLPPDPVGDAGVAATTTSRADCEALMAHVVNLAVAEHAEATLEDREKVRAALGPFMDECLDETPANVHCAMEAPDLDALSACQMTRSNSTSNSSVAPPGITPAAPRSP